MKMLGASKQAEAQMMDIVSALVAEQDEMERLPVKPGEKFLVVTDNNLIALDDQFHQKSERKDSDTSQVSSAAGSFRQQEKRIKKTPKRVKRSKLGGDSVYFGDRT